MKIIVRKSDATIIWGTDNNNTEVVVSNNDLVIDGVVLATNVNSGEYELVSDTQSTLPSYFFVGYSVYVNEVVSPSDEYILWNNKIHDCISTVQQEYIAKSLDEKYTKEERDAFFDYNLSLEELLEIEYIEPSFTFPCPPDEIFPYYPPCL
jgi:hypothetical protein